MTRCNILPRLVLLGAVLLAYPVQAATPIPTDATALMEEAVRLASSGATLLRPEDVRASLARRGRDPILRAAFTRAIDASGSDPALRSQHAEALLRALEVQFIHDPKASTLDLLAPAKRDRYRRRLHWQPGDFPGSPRGPNEGQAQQMSLALSMLCPERRPKRGPGSVVTERELTARMRRHVQAELVALPGEPGRVLNRHAAQAYLTLRAEAAKDGIALTLRDAYRSPEVARRSASRAGNRSAVAAFSSHSLGLAIDLTLSDGRQRYQETSTWPMQNVVDMRQSPAHKWMFLHGAAHGWYPYQHEPWHWEYNPAGLRKRFRGHADRV